MTEKLLSLIRPPEKQPWPLALVLLAVFALARAGLALYGPVGLEPATALAIGILFFTDLRLWPIVAVVSLAAGAVAGEPATQLIIETSARTLQAIFGAALLQWWDVDPIFRRKRDALYTLAAIAAVSFLALVERAAIGTLLGHTPSAVGLVHIYAGAFFSLVVVTPFVLRWCAKPRFGRAPGELAETIGIFALLAICLSLALGTTSIAGVPLYYLVLIPLTWIALRLRPRFVTLALLLVAAIALGSALVHGGADLLALDLRLSVAAAIFLIMSAQEEDRRTTSNAMLSQMGTLQNALARIGAESKAREDFIAVLAHELRNPLAPVVSTIDLLKLKGPRDEEEAQALEIMSSRMDSIRRLLEDLLDVTRLMEGKVSLEQEPLNLRTIIDTSALAIDHYRIERHQKIVIRTENGALWVMGDRVRLEQVFSNLLSNASKYSNSGDTIVVTLRRDGSRAVVSVADTAVGLETGTFDAIFKPFEQVYTGPRKIAGLGIGLALVKHFVELHGGSIAVESGGLGKGSTFTVELPLASVESVPMQAGLNLGATTRAQSPALSAGKLVLVVDDNDAAAGALGRLLEVISYRVAYAYNGAQALKLSRELNPAVILLDINMPDMDGYEVALALRERGFEGLIIALSGYGERDAMSVYGDTNIFDSYLVKPIGLADIRAALPKP